MRIIRAIPYALAVLLTFLALPATAATVRYSYTGADASTYSGSETTYGPPPYPITAPWVPPAPVTGWIELDTNLAANLTNVNISTLVDNWAFDSGGFLQLQNIDFPCNCGSDFTMFVSTNAQGAITEWSLDATTGGDIGYGSFTSRFVDAPLSENGESIFRSYYGSPGICCSNTWTASSASVGSWSATVVPIPGAVWLFASALGLMGWRSRRC